MRDVLIYAYRLLHIVGALIVANIVAPSILEVSDLRATGTV